MKGKGSVGRPFSFHLVVGESLRATHHPVEDLVENTFIPSAADQERFLDGGLRTGSEQTGESRRSGERRRFLW